LQNCQWTAARLSRGRHFQLSGFGAAVNPVEPAMRVRKVRIAKKERIYIKYFN